METASARRASRLAPWLAWTAAVAMMHALGCGNGATDGTSSASNEARRGRAMGALVTLDGGDDSGGIDAGGGSAEAGTGGACTKDGDCISTDYCATNGTCQPQVGPGSACAVGAGGDCRTPGCRECTSNFCDDGVCCGTSSCPGCESCASALQQPFADGGTPGNGTCAPVLVGTNYPAGFCTAGAVNSCLATGLCDGKGECQQFAPAGTACGQPACTSNYVTTPVCNGAGTCHAGSLSCAPYACENGACATSCASSADCSPPSTCNLGTCGAGATLGTTCDTNQQCASGVCADGVCCNQACPGQCEACDVAGAIGTCSPVTGPPHDSHTPCSGEDGGTACGGTCDGTTASACTYPGSTVECNAACSGGQLTSGLCDGTGNCGSMRTAPCQENFGCQSALACNTSCIVNDDCATGFVCIGAKCVTSTSVCVGNTSVLSIDGEDAGVIPCGAYLCVADAGGCTIACKTAADCAPGAICGSSGQCGTSSSGGCSCDVVGARGRSEGAWLLALGLGALVSARRRRPLSSRPRRSSPGRS